MGHYSLVTIWIIILRTLNYFIIDNEPKVCKDRYITTSMREVSTLPSKCCMSKKS